MILEFILGDFKDSKPGWIQKPLSFYELNMIGGKKLSFKMSKTVVLD